MNTDRRIHSQMDNYYRVNEIQSRTSREEEMRKNNLSDGQIQTILVERMSNLNFLLDILLRRREHKRRLDNAKRTREADETDQQYISRLQYFINDCDRLIFEQIRNLDTSQEQEQRHLQNIQRNLQALGMRQEAHETTQTYISRLEAYVHECGIVYSFLYEINEELEKKVQVFENLRKEMFNDEGRIKENISDEDKKYYQSKLEVILATIQNYTSERDALQRQRHAQAFGMSPRRIKCKNNQTRNRSTGRCRKTPRRSGKKRVVNTGRKSKSPSRKSCRPDQVRNRSTGRCQKKKSSKLKSPKRKSRIMKAPCQPDQVRNRSTGRCRRSKKLSANAYATKLML